MSELELQRKQQQLDELQQSFDEYVESSKELEAELEITLQDEMTKAEKSAEAELAAKKLAKELQVRVDRLHKDLMSRSSKSGQNGDSDEQSAEVRRLETENEDLQNQVRVLESTEEDLLHKLQNMEEDVIYLKSDIESLQQESGEPDHRNSDSSALQAASGKVHELTQQLATLESEHSVMTVQHEIAMQHIEMSQKQGSQGVEDLRQKVCKRDAEIEALNLKLKGMAMFERHGQFVDSKGTSRSSSAALHIDSTPTRSRHAQLISGSQDAVLKEELRRLARQYEGLRTCNTRLLHKLQALQGNIQVCCRTRPVSYQEMAQAANISIDAADDNEIMCYDGRSDVWKSFFFDRVWRADASQAEVFADIEPMVVSVLDGYNACIIAYGQTGSGKTFTMDGYGDMYGVNFRAVQTLCDALILRQVQAEAHLGRAEQLRAGEGRARKSEEAFSFELSVSMMEIYNDQVFDLLGGGHSDGVSLDIRQGENNSITVPGLVQTPVLSLQDVMDVFSKGSANRATAATNLNERSSRSHLVVQVEVALSRGGDMPVKSKLSLVDLAGSERVAKSGSTGMAMKEAQHINKSLSALGDVMEALDKKSNHIPYRNSKLTYLLTESLGGSSRTMMIVTVCPTDLTSDESLCTLHFATRVRNISVGPAQKQSNAKNLEASLKLLRAELKDAKRGKLSAEEALLELKKESRKVPPSAVLEAKLRTTEEARKGAETLMQQLNRQITDANLRLLEEKVLREQATGELQSAQNNLRRALEQLTDQTAESQRLQATLLISQQDSETSLRQMQNMQDMQESAVYQLSETVPPSAPSSAPRETFRKSVSTVPPRSLTSARRLAPPSAAKLSAPQRRKSTSSGMREFMLPTASSVAHVSAASADHAAHEQVAASSTHALPHSPCSPVVRPHGGSGSVNTSGHSTMRGVGSSSWQDLMAPTVSSQSHIQAAEREHAQRVKAAASGVHAGLGRMSINPSSSLDLRDSSPLTGASVCSGSDSPNPKGHALEPTAARIASLAAAEEEHTSNALQAASATHAVRYGRLSTTPSGGRDPSPYSPYRAHLPKDARRTDFSSPPRPYEARASERTPTGGRSLLASSSMVKQAPPSPSDARHSSLSTRSDEAMRRHQLRMDKRRELTGSSTAR